MLRGYRFDQSAAVRIGCTHFERDQRNAERGRGEQRHHLKNEEIVIGIKQRNGELRFFHADNVKSGMLVQYIKDNVSQDTVNHTAGE